MEKVTRVCDGCSQEMPAPASKFQTMAAGWRTLVFVGPTGQQAQKRQGVELCPNCVSSVKQFLYDILDHTEGVK